MLSDSMMLGGGRTAAFSIKNSLLFRGAQYLSRTPGVAGDRKTFTLSTWVRRGVLGVTQSIAEAVVGASEDRISFNSDDTLWVAFNGVTYYVKTTAAYRDPTAWLHVVVVVDTTQATAANRIKLYVNGMQVTSFSATNYMAQNYECGWNNAVQHAFGANRNGAPSGVNLFNGYIAEPILIDGAALPASSFGEFDKISGSWRPKKVAGLDFGPNGFHLGKPWDSADLGKDTSGRGNHWTPSGFAATDVVLDSPTNVYATLNPLANFYGSSVNAGNLSFFGPSSAMLNSTLAVPKSGKWWFEVKYSTIGNAAAIGLSTDALASHSRFCRSDTGEKVIDGVTTPYGASWGTANTMNIAVDMDAGTLALYKDGVSQGVLASDLVSSGYTWFLFVSSNAAAHVGSVNFGQRPFTYAPPGGYKALCTANLPTPSAAAKQPWKYYSCQTVVHDGATTAVALGWDALATDWLVRIKSLSTGSWYWLDTKRGLDRYLLSDNPAAEGNNPDLVVGWVAGGFSLGSGFAAGSYLVEAWRVAPEAGFDIVAFTSPASGTFSIGHDNGSVPKLVLAKSRSSASTHWLTYHAEVPGKFLLLDTTDAAAADAAYFNGAPTATAVNFGAAANFPADSAYVAYLWSEVPGFSKFGSYTGNGSADGPFNYCGFTPASFTVKSAGSSSQWPTINTAVVPYNVSSSRLYLNLSNANQSGFHDLDVNANGVKVRVAAADSGGNDFNTAGGTYIYAAFAAHPLGGKRVSPATAR